METILTYAPEAFRTLSASRFTLWLARHFGERIIGSDGNVRVEIRRWRGKMYLIDYWTE